MFSLALSAVAFLALDYARTTHIYLRTNSGPKPVNCRVSDPIRHHAFRPDCTSMDRWGGDAYQFYTNNLGFRDDHIRNVPLMDAKPRILVLGDSFTEGKVPWGDSYVGQIAAHFPDYDFLNGGIASYAPSNYFNVAKMVLNAGYDIDEIIVFIDISDVSDEAAFYRDIDSSGAVTGPLSEHSADTTWSRLRQFTARHFLVTNSIIQFFEKQLVEHGFFHLNDSRYGDEFDMELSAWTYRKVNEKLACPAGYAPLGAEGGIAKEKVKMTRLWQELQARKIPISVVVYPWPAQILHDTAESRQVVIWRDWCEGKCKRFVSLFPAFLSLRQQCPAGQPGCWYLKYFIFGDNHYNAAGNTIVAEAVIQSLSQTPPQKRVPLTTQ